MPLGADVMQLAQQAPPQQIHRVVVQDAVMPLVADRQVQAQFIGHAAHDLALRDVVRHQLFGQDVLARLHRLARRGRMQMQRQSDNDRFDVRILKQRLVTAVLGVVDLDVLAGLVFGLPAVNGHQAFAGRQGRR